MADRDPMSAEESHQLAHHKSAKVGKIKRPQQTDATMPEKDLPRGNEPETRGTSGRRQ